MANVSFYRNGVAITTLTAAPYSFTWTGVPAGSYTLTAVATDDLGSSTTSAQVTLTVGAGGAQTYFIETDHLNMPRVVQDKSQNLVWSWANTEPFGNNPPNNDPSGFGAFDMPLRFVGQYSDHETGLFYNYFRDYDSSIGRYAQSDPIGLQGGLDTYLYVDGNPLLNTDPLGLEVTIRHYPRIIPTPPPPNTIQPPGTPTCRVDSCTVAVYTRTTGTCAHGSIRPYSYTETTISTCYPFLTTHDFPCSIGTTPGIRGALTPDTRPM